MIKSEMKFGFIDEFDMFFNNDTESVGSAILRKAVRCTDRGECFKLAAIYQNFSTVNDDLNMNILSDLGKLMDENKRPLLCELQDGSVSNVYLVLLVHKGSPLLEFINNIIEHLVEGGILINIRKRYFYKENIVPMFDSTPFDASYTAFGVGHLQTAFYLLMLGYVLALICFVTEIMWHSYRSNGRQTIRTSPCHRHTQIDTVDRTV
jgi:hypothetical protein